MVDANVDIEYYYKLKRSMRKLEEKIRMIDKKIDGYGVGSPRIMSPEEAKYQKGTRTYSDVPLLELIAEQDRLKEELKESKAVFYRIHDRMIALNMTPEEADLMTMRYERRKTYEQIAEATHYAKASIQCKIDAVLKRYINLKD